MYHIFIVDDDSSFRRSLAIQLELEGYKVSEADSADEALKTLERLDVFSNCPNLVISDIRMPGMSGIDFAKEIQHKFSHISILIMSAFIQNDNKVPFTFFKKPFKTQKLVDYIKHIQATNYA